METRFQGLVLFLIGLSDLLAAYTISQAETAEVVQLTPILSSTVGISAPTGILWVLGFILVLAGVIWVIIGGKFEIRIHWK